MGETISIDKKEHIQDTLHFVQIFEDANFGPIEIFRFKEPPYQYIMDYKKTFMEGDSRAKHFLELVNSLKEMEHKNLAKVHFYELRQQTHMCIKDRKAHIYCNYYNFTLSQAIEKKKLLKTNFPQSQLIYIINCLLDLAQYLKKYQISFGTYRSDHIYISPQGYIKVYLLDIEKQNKHHCYYKALTEKSEIENLVLSPQQLYYINNLQYEIKFSLEKADIFAIGMIILELVTLDKIKFYYNQAFTQLKMGRIQFDVTILSQTYGYGFVNLLKTCLKQNPNERCTFEEALNQLQEIKKNTPSMSYCIRLQDDDEANKKKFKPQGSLKSQYILNGLQKKLTPSPITTLSSTTSSNFRVDVKKNINRQKISNKISSFQK